MDTGEALTVETSFHAVHRLAKQVRLGAEMQADVVAGRLDPVHFVGAEEEDAAARLHDETVHARRFRLDVVDQRQQTAAEVPGATPLETLARVPQRLLEAL